MANIAISSNTSWYLFNFRKNTIIALLNSGHRVIVIAPKDDYSSKLELLGVEFIHIDIDQKGTSPIRDFKTLLAFYRIYSNHQIDVVLNFTPKNNIYSTLAASKCGVKVINNISGLGVLFINEGIISKIVRLLYKVSQKYASKIFFQNEDDLKFFLENNIVNEAITERLPGSGVDLSRFKFTPAQDDGVVRFLLTARMLYDKGISHYVETARELKHRYNNKVEFRLLGFLNVNNPSAVSQLEMQNWVNEGVVNYLGVSDCVEEEIAKIDCMVLPSFYREGVPKSLLEAGAIGRPIVTTDNVGCRELVEHGVNGYLCLPRNTTSLTEMLDKVVNLSHQERLNMGQKSRHLIETEYDEQIVIKKYLSAINEIL